MMAMATAVIGGLGLFMLGMWLMSDGLRMAAGNRLYAILHQWTQTRLRGLGTGFMLTALVQHSGAVSVATIGFTNAGLLSLRRAVWIIFGSNVGTTVTGWLVALLGFNVNISAFALPMIGAGMLLKLTRSNSSTGHIGQAMVGFGVLFLGIDVLKDSFASIGDSLTLDYSSGQPLVDTLIYAGVGLIITTMMQSSSLILALALTALAGGIISLPVAAAIVIGSNVGSTTTAVFSAFGSSASAKRVVSSHVIFNLLTAAVALLLLSPLLSVILFLQGLFSGEAQLTTTLVLFHTTFNVMGVMLIWPMADSLLSWLSQRFKTREEDDGKPLYLDKQALKFPTLALDALKLELNRLGSMVLDMARDSIQYESTSHNIRQRDGAVKNLLLAIGDYTNAIYRQSLDEDMAMKLAVSLRVSQYYDAIADLSVMLNSGRPNMPSELPEDIDEQITRFAHMTLHLLKQTQLDMTENRLDEDMASVEKHYQSLKSLLLRRGAEGRLSIANMDRLMTAMSQIRRMGQQAAKAWQHYQSLHSSDVDQQPTDETTTAV